MKIDHLEIRREPLPLTKPYTIARRTIAAVDLVFVRLHAGAASGIGDASPGIGVTGESVESCEAALDRASEILVGRAVGEVGSLARTLERELAATPAARAACDMALWDLLGRRLGVPLVELLGRAHEALPTSVTIGIKSTEEAVEEARSYLAAGFRALKVKLGRDLEADLERLARLREAVGPSVAIRTDANAGYDLADLRRYLDATRALDLELCEQPVPRGREAELQTLPAHDRARLVADESLHGPADAARLMVEPRPFGIFNIKLMKCGGVSPARRIAELADAAGIELMWGCMDESRVSIAAALHTALASPATRYLDLDGSFDLARDLVEGGFALRDGRLFSLARPGLGVQWIGE